jgi:hypothetical protein
MILQFGDHDQLADQVQRECERGHGEQHTDPALAPLRSLLPRRTLPVSALFAVSVFAALSVSVTSVTFAAVAAFAVFAVFSTFATLFAFLGFLTVLTFSAFLALSTLSVFSTHLAFSALLVSSVFFSLRGCGLHGLHGPYTR